MSEATQRFNFYNENNTTASGLKERIDPVPTIRRVIDSFRGIERDHYGRVIDAEKYPVMNLEGCMRAKSFLSGMVTSITHLSNYSKEDTINRQVRSFVEQWIIIIVKNRKRWEIIDRETVLAEVENLIFESKSRTIEGFEASLTGKAHQVSEIIQQETKDSGSRFNIFNRRRNNEMY